MSIATRPARSFGRMRARHKQGHMRAGAELFGICRRRMCIWSFYLDDKQLPSHSPIHTHACMDGHTCTKTRQRQLLRERTIGIRAPICRSCVSTDGAAQGRPAAPQRQRHARLDTRHTAPSPRPDRTSWSAGPPANLGDGVGGEELALERFIHMGLGARDFGVQRLWETVTRSQVRMNVIFTEMEHFFSGPRVVHLCGWGKRLGQPV